MFVNAGATEVASRGFGVLNGAGVGVGIHSAESSVSGGVQNHILVLGAAGWTEEDATGGSISASKIISSAAADSDRKSQLHNLTTPISTTAKNGPSLCLCTADCCFK